MSGATRVSSTMLPEPLTGHKTFTTFCTSERRVAGVCRQPVLVQLVLLLELRSAHLAGMRLLSMNPLVSEHFLLRRKLFATLRTGVLTPLIIRRTLLDIILHHFLRASRLMSSQVIAVLELFVAVLAFDRHIPILGGVDLLVGDQGRRPRKANSAVPASVLLCTVRFDFYVIPSIFIIIRHSFHFHHRFCIIKRVQREIVLLIDLVV